jgi:hypothetical protein
MNPANISAASAIIRAKPQEGILKGLPGGIWWTVKETTMKNARLISIAIFTLIGVVPALALQEDPKGSPPPKKGPEHAQTVLSEKEHATMGLFVVGQLENGVRGKALAEAIHQEHETLKQEHEAREKNKEEGTAKSDAQGGEGKNGPGESLKHGLSDKDITNFGKFVNEQHAAGLRGEELADAICKKHEEMRAARAKEQSESRPSNSDHPRRPPGHR